MSVRRVGPRRPGRPLLGVEPLSQRLTVMISASMQRRLAARAGNRVAEFVRAALGRALTGVKVGTLNGRRRRRGRRSGRIHR